VSAAQSGAWNTGLTGSLPAFAATPTFNLGTLNGAALDASVQQVKTALGSPLQAGGAVSVSNLPATQAISAASLPLPSGAATAAKQPALGVAGTAATDVITVQGASGGVPQPISGTVAATQSGAWTAGLSTVSTALAPAVTAVGVSAVQIFASGASTNMRTIKALKANTATCYIGASGVSTTAGFPLDPGDSYTMDTKLTTAAVFVLCAQNSQNIAVIGF
jgi:hypothetical protein